MTKLAFYRTVWVGSLLAIIAMMFLFVTHPKAALTAASTTMMPFMTEDTTIRLRYPRNWKPDSGSEHAVMTYVNFTPDKTTRFLVKTDLTGSLLGDVARSPVAGMEALPGMPQGGSQKQKSPLETVHEMQGQTMEKDDRRYTGYRELETKKTQVAGVEALVTEFVYVRMVGPEPVRMVGKRISALTGERRLALVATCRQSDHDLQQKVFPQMIESVQVSTPGGQ